MQTDVLVLHDAAREAPQSFCSAMVEPNCTGADVALFRGAAPQQRSPRRSPQRAVRSVGLRPWWKGWRTCLRPTGEAHTAPCGKAYSAVRISKRGSLSMAIFMALMVVSP